MRSLRSGLVELPQYFLVSCCGLAVDAGLLLLMTQAFGIPYLLATTLSFVVGGIVGYQLCIRFVWHVDPGASRSIELTSFILLGAVGLAVNSIVMFGIVSGLHGALLVGKGVAAGCTFFCNYALRRRWVFPQAKRRAVPWLAELRE